MQIKNHIMVGIEESKDTPHLQSTDDGVKEKEIQQSEPPVIKPRPKPRVVNATRPVSGGRIHSVQAVRNQYLPSTANSRHQPQSGLRARHLPHTRFTRPRPSKSNT